MNVKKGVCLLRIETDNENVEIPPFISKIRDVKQDPGYSTYILAKKSYYVNPEDKPYILEADEDDED
jgi:hypothetical protein